MILINSKYEIASNELNAQVKDLTNLVKEYDENAILAGEGPLMSDLVEIADHDFNSVTIASIVVIFIIMLFVLKSISLPIILISVIEFAIFINMSISYYTNVTLPFVASIVIGTIQLGATIDYAILITNKYIVARKDGKNKKEAAKESLGTSIGSIAVSGLCFFGATFGVGAYSKIEMIGSLCTLMSRGAIISMLTVICVLPAFLMIFDKIICKTTIGMKKIN
jgi:predicted RND superfamily exporter protein